jgi:hypothetical protein
MHWQQQGWAAPALQWLASAVMERHGPLGMIQLIGYAASMDTLKEALDRVVAALEPAKITRK